MQLGKPHTDLGVLVYKSGLSHLSACAPKEMPVGDVQDAVNESCPTGIDSSWVFAKDEPTFATGQSNPCPCNWDDARVHYLFVC